MVLADAGYGIDTSFRDGVTDLGLAYVMGIQGSTSVWPPGLEPLPAKPWSGRGRPTSKLRRTDTHKPVSAKDLAISLPPRTWRTITWREGSNAPLSSRFAAVRVRPAHRDTKLKSPRPVEWLLIEWPKGDKEPAKYWLSTLPKAIALRPFVEITKLRWRIERDYQDLKQEIGLGDYEGRGWRGFHHHATLSIAAYGFLISERGAIPPSGPRIRARAKASRRKAPRLPADYRPRGSPDPDRAPHHQLDRHTPTTPRQRTRAPPRSMSMLRKSAAFAE